MRNARESYEKKKTQNNSKYIYNVLNMQKLLFSPRERKYLNLTLDDNEQASIHTFYYFKFWNHSSYQNN